jgi:hypothetical protein
MNKESRSNTVLIIVLVTASCLVLLCAALFLLFPLFGVAAPRTVEAAPVETTTLSAPQLEPCRKVMAIQESVAIEGEYYRYTPGFLDDSLECHLRVSANSLEDIFDLTIVDPSQTANQEVSPGRYLQLTIKIIEPGLYLIEGFWFET